MFENPTKGPDATVETLQIFDLFGHMLKALCRMGRATEGSWVSLFSKDHINTLLIV